MRLPRAFTLIFAFIFKPSCVCCGNRLSASFGESVVAHLRRSARERWRGEAVFVLWFCISFWRSHEAALDRRCGAYFLLPLTPVLLAEVQVCGASCFVLSVA